MREVLVSIVVPVYNVEKFLVQCLHSCVQQSYKNIEIICVDDCSNDNSKAVVQDFKNQDPRVVLIENEENKGVFFSKDLGARNAKGDFLFFVDGDDYLATDAIETLQNEIVGNVENVENVDIVAGNMELVDEQYNKLGKTLSWRNFGEMDSDRFLSQVVYLNRWSQCCMLIRRSVYEKIHFLPFQVKIREDAIILLQLCSLSDKVITIDKSIYNYVQRKTSALNQSKSIDQRALEDVDYALSTNEILKQLTGISTSNRVLIELDLIKELSWSLESKANWTLNKTIIYKVIRKMIVRKSLLVNTIRLQGVKIFLFYVATFIYPKFWIVARSINRTRKKTVTSINISL